MSSASRPPIDQTPLSPYLAWAGDRNKGAILEAFRPYLPAEGHALELGSGAGLHVNHFAAFFPQVRFQPSDYDEDVFATIRAKRAALGNTNVDDPIRIDLTDPSTFPAPDVRRYRLIFAINLFQAAPISIAEGLASLAEALLDEGGVVAIYGPFKIDGAYTTTSNRSFDEAIQSVGVAEWGLKDIRDLERATIPHGLRLVRRIDLPAANFVFVFAHDRTAASGGASARR